MTKLWLHCTLFLTILQTIYSQAPELEDQNCVLRDYMSFWKIFIKQDTKISLQNVVYEHSRIDSDGSLTTVYFTVCGNLPWPLRKECGVEENDDTVYTFIEIINGTKCIPRTEQEMVTARIFTKQGKDQIDHVYKNPDNSEMIVISFVLDPQSPLTSNSVNYTATVYDRVLSSKPTSLYRTTINSKYVEARGMYLFNSRSVLYSLLFGLPMFILNFICTFYFNHFSHIKNFHPFNFYVNFYIAWRIIDYTIQLFFFPLSNRYFTTAFILTVPVLFAILAERLGPGFTYTKTIYWFYALVVSDAVILYSFCSLWILLLGCIHIAVLVFYVSKTSRLKNLLADSEEWSISVMLSLNLAMMLLMPFRPVKNFGAIRLMINYVPEYYSSIYITGYVLITFVMIPFVAMLRYKHSNIIIVEHFHRRRALSVYNDRNSLNGGLTVVEEDDFDHDEEKATMKL